MTCGSSRSPSTCYLFHPKSSLNRSGIRHHFFNNISSTFANLSSYGKNERIVNLLSSFWDTLILSVQKAAEDKITKNNHFCFCLSQNEFSFQKVKVEKKNMAKVICLSCFKELDEEKIFSCSKKHHFCAPCGKSMHLQCEVKCPKIAIKIPSHRNSITLLVLWNSEKI